MSRPRRAYRRPGSSGNSSRSRCYAEAFGTAVRVHRLKAGLTEQQLAIQAELEEQDIYEIEQGRVSSNLRELAALAAVANGCMVSLTTILREADRIFLRNAARNLH
ncbi:MAG: helix-turn-helix domain-containing protein [Steroidobacteraceae bacterium]